MPRKLLGLGDALLGHRDRLVLLVELEVVVGDELLLGLRVHALGLLAGDHLRGELGEAVVEVGRLLGRAGDDQRRPRLVDEDVVDLVDDRVVVHADRLAVLADAAAVLDLLLQRRGHVVAQVVEAELGVRAVRDVGRVGGALVLVGLHVLQHARREPEAVVDRAHPLGVAAGEVVVDRDDVDALAGERVEHDGERARQRLALAGAHLGDGAAVEHHAADHLDVEVAHASCAGARPRARPRRSPASRSSSDSPSRGALAQRVGLRAQLLVVQQLELGLPRVDGVDALRVALELLGLAHPQGAIEDRHSAKDRGCRRSSRRAAQTAGRVPRRLRVRPRAAAAATVPRRAARGALRRLSRWRLTWRASSSAIRLIECLMSREELRRAQGDALEVEGRLGDVGLRVGGVALLGELDLEHGQLARPACPPSRSAAARTRGARRSPEGCVP